MKQPQTFENFLQDKHADDYTGIDDDMPDAYESWLTDLDIEDLINYADEYATEQRNEALRHVANQI